MQETMHARFEFPQMNDSKVLRLLDHLTHIHFRQLLQMSLSNFFVVTNITFISIT